VRNVGSNAKSVLYFCDSERTNLASNFGKNLKCVLDGKLKDKISCVWVGFCVGWWVACVCVHILFKIDFQFFSEILPILSSGYFQRQKIDLALEHTFITYCGLRGVTSEFLRTDFNQDGRVTFWGTFQASCNCPHGFIQHHVNVVWAYSCSQGHSQDKFSKIYFACDGVVLQEVITQQVHIWLATVTEAE